MGRDESQPILGSSEPPSASLYEHARRPYRDSAWGVLYVFSLVLAFIGGVYALVHRNKDFATLASVDYLSDPSHCPASSSSSNSGPTRHLLLEDGQDPDDYTPTFFIEAAGACTAISVVGGLLLGLGSLMLVQKRPHACVGAAVGLQVGLPALAGLLLLANGAGAGSLPLFLTAGILAFVFYLYRQQLALVGRLLAIASNALWQNCAAIVGGSLLLQLAGLLVTIPLVFGLILAFANGGVVPNPAVVDISKGGGGGGEAGSSNCTDAQGLDVLCCAWQPDGWAMGYMAWASLMIGWSTLLAFTLKVFVVSGITAQWYFALAGSNSKGSLRTALGHAFGPSFGSLCLASWLLNLLNMLKSMAQQARAENRDNILVQLLVSCFEFLLTILEAVTKFAVVRMAITGEAMFPSCRSTADLLARNLLDSVGVWWFPGMILQVTGLLLSGLWGGAVFGVSYAYWGRSQVALSSGVMLGVVAFLFGLLTISYLNSVLLSIVDAVYICFAMDKDRHTMTRPDVHQVYVLLPSNKAPMGVVEQPDGSYAFADARQQQQQQQSAYQPPAHYGAQPAPGYPSIPRE